MLLTLQFFFSSCHMWVVTCGCSKFQISLFERQCAACFCDMPSVLSTKPLLFVRSEKKGPVGNKASDHEKIDQKI